MTPPPRSYQFSAVPNSSLLPFDRDDPFRFHQDSEAAPLRSPDAPTSIILEAFDADGNRSLTREDQFYYRSDDGRRLRLPPDSGLQLLNYYLDPSILRQKRLGVVIHSQNGAPGAVNGEILLKDIPRLSPEDRDFIIDSHFPYWEVDGHVNMDIVEGIRLFTSDENERWTGWRGVPIFLNWRYFRNRVLLEKGAVAATFMVGEHFINPAFMWRMYTTNFFSMVGGSVAGNSQLEGGIYARNNLLTRDDVDNSLRRVANIHTARDRARISEDHLYFTLTWPVVIAACFGDANFRRFWPAPWRLPRPGILYNHFADQFSRAIPSMGRSPMAVLRNPVGLGALALSAFSIYEISSLWFDVYGHLPQGSTENRIFSGASTVLTEAWLLSRSSRELEAVTGSGAIDLANFRAFVAAKPRLGVVAELPEGGLFTRYWQGSERTRALFENSRFLPEVRTVPAVAHNPLGKLFNRLGAPRIGLEARIPAAAEGTVYRTGAEGAALLEEAAVGAPRVAATESLLARAAVTAEIPAALRTAETITAVAEGVAIRSRVRLVGMPLLGLAVGVGLALGGCYAFGVFGRRHSTRDMARDLTGR